MKAILIATILFSLTNFGVSAHAEATPASALRELMDNHMVQGALYEIQKMTGKTATCSGLKILTLKNESDGYYSVTARAICETPPPKQGDDGGAVMIHLEGESFDGTVLIVDKIEMEIIGG